MITLDNFPRLLDALNFKKTGASNNDDVYTKKIGDHELKVDFKQKVLMYPEGVTAARDTTKNFSQAENFVVFVCVHHLLQSGYQPEHIILEQGMPGGHGMTGGFCDIIVQDNASTPYLLIECKTADDPKKSKEFTKAWNKMLLDGGQLFNYFNSYREAQWLCLYAADFDEAKQEVVSIYHLISMQDNEKYLQSNSHLIGFKQLSAENKGKDEYFKVWKDTYQCDFISHNLFESEVFNIGRRPFAVSDLKIVDGVTIQKKYHQFATIMRQHNVSGRENAFDKLVNLFLCKVVDEQRNPDNLHVYWKGAASDDHFSLQDRLQKLYKEGMMAFLGEDVTYIEEKQIEDAFIFFKNKKDETKKTILDYFKQLKFYSNNAFAFLDVHNEKLFLQNAVILKDVVQMLQDMRLKNEDEQHQFLGDLFEGFLDQGVKQSEGQFFTPLPIVKFLIASLPLAQILEQEKMPKVIDYACGAGHFLTEYASQIKTILGKEQSDKLEKHYQNIVGIEKEYRLSKVAKVSAFMYGQNQINIIYADALAQNERVKNQDYSILVANPPYSVKGFLATLSEDDKQKYDLYKDLAEDAFNSIETFFIERAKQLLKSGGVAAIILPSSVLTNGNVYIKCREIILKYFELVAIVEFGSGTFGKTGTNTATLFLRRKGHRPDAAEHYKNRVEAWFSNDFDANVEATFEDAQLLKNYCAHCGFDFAQYQAFLAKQDSKLLEHELFQEYTKAFNEASETKALKNKKSFKELSQDEQEKKLQAARFAFMHAIERDKVYFYLLAQRNGGEVLIVKSPADKNAMKSFLGYEWSSAKGNEGIKYIGASSSDEDGLNQGIFQIQTPLFNPHDLNDENKLNSTIRKHFMGEALSIAKAHQDWVSVLPLTEMLDFSRVSFDKALRTSVQKKVEIKSKYPLVKLGNIAEISRGASPRPIDHYLTNSEDGIHWIKIGDVAPNAKYITQTKQKITQEGAKKSKFVDIGDFIISNSMSAGRPYILKIKGCIHDGWLLISNISSEIIKDYLYYVLTSEHTQKQFDENAVGGVVKNLNTTRVSGVKIPLPPLDIQAQIVAECESIDQEYENSRMSIENYREKIANLYDYLYNLATETVRLSNGDLFDVSIGKRVTEKEFEKNGKIPVYSANVMSPFGYIDDLLISKFDKPSVLWGIDGDWMTNCLPVGYKFYPTDHCGVLRVKKEDVLNEKYLAFALERIGKELKFSRVKRASIERIKGVQIPVPPLEQQKTIVAEIEGYEAQIQQLENIMRQSADKKKAVLAKYLE